jgi:hypothetical protein
VEERERIYGKSALQEICREVIWKDLKPRFPELIVVVG